MRKTWYLISAAALTAVVIGPGIARADIYMKQNRHTGAFTVMGQTQPEKNETIVTWLGNNKTRADIGDEKSIIMLIDRQVMLMLDHGNMTYSEMPLELNKMLDEAVAGRGEEAQKAMKMMRGLGASLMKIEVAVTDTGEKKKIKEWDCRKYIIKTKMAMGQTTSEAWASEDLKVDFKLYTASAYAMMSGQPGFQEMLKEMEKVKGVIVLNKSTGEAMGAEVTTTEELVEFARKSAPAGTYDIPHDYKKIKNT